MKNALVIAVCLLMFSACKKEETQNNTTEKIVGVVDLDSFIMMNPSAKKIEISGDNEKLVLSSDLSKATTTYSLGFYSSIIVTRLSKTAMNNKTLRITVNAGRGSLNGCNDRPFLTMPNVEKVVWNNNSMTVLQQVQTTLYSSYYKLYDGAGCSLAPNSPSKKQGTINQYDVANYQEIGWKISTGFFSSTFSVTIDIL